MLSQMCPSRNNPEEFVTANPLAPTRVATIHCRMLASTSLPGSIGDGVNSGPCSPMVESGPEFLLSSLCLAATIQKIRRPQTHCVHRTPQFIVEMLSPTSLG